MTSEEKIDLEKIYLEGKWNTHQLLGEYLKNAGPTEEPRSKKQNNALHAWFAQIAKICQNQGVTFNLIISHTHDVEVTPTGVKGLWHVLQKALYGTDTTTKLTKSGQIDTMIDHFCNLFGKEGVELPPFPSEENKPDYPEYNGPPTI
jgi:hypothetical protein